MFLHSRPRLFWVTIAASLFFLNCNQVRSPEESETNGLLSDTFADQTLIDNSVSRCALGLGSGAVESVTGFFDFLKGLWTAAKYIIETDIDGLMLLHWNETFREIARERLAEKGAKQRELVTNLVSVAYNAVPLTRQYLNQEYSWYDSLPAHHQSEFLCKVLLTVPADIMIGIAGSKGIDSLARLEGFAKVIEKVKYATGADLEPGSQNFVTNPSDWHAKNLDAGADSDLIAEARRVEAAKGTSGGSPGSNGSFIGSGSFADAYREGDDVIKIIRSEVGHGTEIWRLSDEDRAHLARVQVEFMQDLREADDIGSLIPPASIEGPGKIRSKFIDGKTMADLSGDAKIFAIDEATSFVSKANRYFGLSHGETGELDGGWRVLVDDNMENFRFNADGSIAGWIDPIAIFPPDSKRAFQ